MKRVIISILSAVSLFLCAGGRCIAQDSANLPFQDGENLKIVIHYKWGFNADIAEMNLRTTEETLQNGKNVFHIQADASTYKFWDGFFKVRDVYESKFYPDLKPYYFFRDISEGGHWAKNWYDWNNGGKNLHAIVIKKGRPDRDTSYTDKVIIRDLINLICDFRACDIDAVIGGKKKTYVMAMDKDIIDVSVRFVKREEKNLGTLGKFNTIKLGIALSPRAKNDDEGSQNFSLDYGEVQNNGQTGEVFYGKDKIFLWLTDDDNHMPVYFSAPVAVGSINGRVVKIEGNKYPLTSKIN
jgi:Protein of unknown function (DUF3108).